MKITNKSFIYRKYFNKIEVLCIFTFFSIFFSFVKGSSSDVPISFTINPGQITYGAPSNLSLGQISLSQSQQNVEGQFDDYFWVSDLAGFDSGYNTTIVSDGFMGPNGNILTGIYLMAGNNGTPELMLGSPGNVMINPVFSGDYYSIFASPVTYIYRPQSENYLKINKYGDKPWIRVVVPPYTSPGMYSGTIYIDI